MSNQEIELSETRKLEGVAPPVVVETKQPETQPASISTLFFRFSTKIERVIWFFGFACTWLIIYWFLVVIASGILCPLAYTYCGDLINVLIHKPLIASDVVFVLCMFIGLMALSSFFAFCERFCLSFFAGWFRRCYWCTEHVTIRFRQEYTKSVMKHDVEYIENISPGRLGQRFSEESSRIVIGLGPELGTMVRAFASMVTGCVLGFYYVGNERMIWL